MLVFHNIFDKIQVNVAKCNTAKMTKQQNSMGHLMQNKRLSKLGFPTLLSIFHITDIDKKIPDTNEVKNYRPNKLHF